jgi:hypothetical protein
VIPNLTLMICAYIVFRCFESVVTQFQKPDRPVAGLIVAVLAAMCAVVAIAVTVDTFSSGISLQQQLSPLIR